jgi:hypothetical protein
MNWHDGLGPAGYSFPAREVGDLVIGAADGDRSAWEQLVDNYADLVSTITVAHRLNEAHAAQVRATVWHWLGCNLGKIRQPDRVGVWLAAVTRDECVKALASPASTAA